MITDNTWLKRLMETEAELKGLYLHTLSSCNMKDTGNV